MIETPVYLPSARRPRPGRPRKANGGHVVGTSDAGALDSRGQNGRALAQEANAPSGATAAERREERRLRALAAVQPRLLDVPETAVYVGLPESSVYDLSARGVLRRVRVPLPNGGEMRKLLFDRADLDRMVDRWKDAEGAP